MVRPITKQSTRRGKGFNDQTSLTLNTLSETIIAIEVGNNTREQLTQIIPKPSWDTIYKKKLLEDGILILEGKGKNQLLSINWEALIKTLNKVLLKELQEHKQQLTTTFSEIKPEDAHSVVGTYKEQMRKDFDHLFKQEQRIAKVIKDKTLQRDKRRKQIISRMRIKRELEHFKDLQIELNAYLLEYEKFIKAFKEYAESFKERNKQQWLASLLSSYFERIHLFTLLQTDVHKKKEGFTITEIMKQIFETIATGNNVEYNLKHHYYPKKEYSEQLKKIAKKYAHFNRGFESILISLPRKQAYYAHLEKQIEEEERKYYERMAERYDEHV